MPTCGREIRTLSGIYHNPPPLAYHKSPYIQKRPKARWTTLDINASKIKISQGFTNVILRVLEPRRPRRAVLIFPPRSPTSGTWASRHHSGTVCKRTNATVTPPRKPPSRQAPRHLRKTTVGGTAQTRKNPCVTEVSTSTAMLLPAAVPLQNSP